MGIGDWAQSLIIINQLINNINELKLNKIHLINYINNYKKIYNHQK